MGYGHEREPAGSWEGDQRLIAFARARLRELERENPQDTPAHRYVRTAQRLVEEFVDRRRDAGRKGLHGRDALSGTEVWGLRFAVVCLVELWADHPDFREDWRQ
jgi:hypothetical protein